jgi:thiosulfate dehydrogenase [quinone] large subunit
VSYRVVILGDNHEKDHQEDGFDQNKKDAWSSSRFIKWRLRGIAVLRIIFGLLWAFDAWTKWQMLPTLSTTHFLQTINEQPSVIAAWMKLWLHVVDLNAHLFLTCVILGEVCVALCLIVGAFNRLACGAGMFLTLLLWSTAIGFVWPYGAGATTTTVVVISLLASLGLWLGDAGQTFSLQRYLPTSTWPLLTAQRAKEREQVPHAQFTLPFDSQSTPIAPYHPEAGRSRPSTTSCSQIEPAKDQRLLPM